jgi:ATP-binding cassette subfamily B protein
VTTSIEPLPSPRRALAVSAGIAFRAAPLLGIASFVLVPFAWMSGTLFTVFLARLVDARQHGQVTAITATLAVLISLRWLVDALSVRLFKTFEERVGVVLERACADACADTPGIEHFERPEYLDRFELVRADAWIIHWMFEALVEFSGSLVRAAAVVGLLVAIDVRLVAAPVVVIGSVAMTIWQRRRAVPIEEAVRDQHRLARHLFRTSLNPDAALELRMHRAGRWLRGRRRDAWKAQHRVNQRLRLERVATDTLASILFVAVEIAGIIIVVRRARDGAATPGQTLLVVSLFIGLQQTVALVAETGGWLIGCLETSRRFVWLMDLRSTAKALAHWDGPAAVLPARLHHGIELEGVRFTYPGTTHEVLGGVDLRLPAGSVVALVGANGSGKTTLVKLLLRLYEPDAGTIRVDGVPLVGIDLDDWRRRSTAAFQDFHRTELTLQEAVGIGDLDRLDDAQRASAALADAGADALLGLPRGLETQLGPKWPGGVGLSGGQWQQVATARASMRGDPLLTVLDEPTAHLDAHTEHALFERYARLAKGATSQSGIVLLVTHRFSTVRMADVIVVIDGGAVIETGSHRELLARGGTYAALYRIQSDQYR